MRTSTIILASAGALLSGITAYAIYFDYRRQTDPAFRKALKREERRQARIAREEQEAHGLELRRGMEAAVAKSRAEGIPDSLEEREAMFLEMVGSGEALARDEANKLEAATCFYKALKVYPNPRDLIGIYDKIVPKPIIDILAEMIALDGSIQVSLGGPNSVPGIDHGLDD